MRLRITWTHGSTAPDWTTTTIATNSTACRSQQRPLPAFAKTRRVIAVEQQGHGHTADIDRPLTSVQMADDVADLLRQLKVDNAAFFGYSMGGGVALQMALHHPRLVRKIVFAGGTTYNPDGFHPELLRPWRK